MSTESTPDLRELLTLGGSSPRLVDRLEGALLSPRLPDVVASLRRLLGAGTAREALDDVLGGHRADVLAEGLAGLPPERLNRLLRQPELLPALQEELLLAEAPYWERRLAEALPAPQWDLADEPVVEEVVVRPLEPQPESVSGRERSSRGRGRRASWLVALAGAALVAAVWLWPGDPRWGWQRSGALTVELGAPEYLRHLAQLAGEFDTGSTETVSGLDRRLTEMLAACQLLIESPHPQLAATDRDWLRERCQAWMSKLDQQRARLREPGVSSALLASVREESRQIVQTLREKLNERAAGLEKGAT